MTGPIGGKVKRLRLAKGLRLAELAAQVGCSESLLSKIENDKAMPSVMTLHKLTQAVGSSISALFSDDHDPERVVLRKNERTVIDFRVRDSVEGTVVERIAPMVEDALLQAMIFNVEPGGRTLGSITHQGEDFGYVLEGEIDLIVDGRSHHLQAGDAFRFPSETPHGYHNAGQAICRVVWVNTPVTF